MSKSIICLILAASLAALQIRAVAAPCDDSLALPSTLELSQGQQVLEELAKPLKRLSIADPEIADVSLIGRNAFLLVGKAPGSTSLMVWGSCSTQPTAIQVAVLGGDTAQLMSLGNTGDAGAMPSQVQTDIRFVEVSRSKLKSASTSIFGTGSGNFLFGSPGTTGGVSVSPGSIASISPSIPLNDSGFNVVWGGGSSKVLGMINALENSGFAYTLARPSLVSMSGQSASFLAGGEVPIPVPSSGSDSISIEYKEFGVRLTLTPTVLGAQRINLKVAPEVSDLDYTNGVQIQGTMVPALNVRRTDTSIMLADGESFIISGLISSTNSGAVDKFPGLGDIPILGALFRSNNIQREDRELLMIVTPHLVRPIAANASLPALPGDELQEYDPSFWRMYFQESGKFENTGLSQ